MAEHGPVRGHASRPPAAGWAVRPWRPPASARRSAGSPPGCRSVGRRHAAFNADRLLNRFILFPRYARQAVRRFDLFHVADHTYGQLVHALPAGRTGVYCHDLDAFRCLFDKVCRPQAAVVPRHVPANPDRAAEGGGRLPQHGRRWRRDQAGGIDRPRPAGPRSLWSVARVHCPARPNPR